MLLLVVVDLHSPQFSRVFLADYAKDGGAPVRVAVKLIRLPTPPVELEEVTFEADIMLTINHPAILKVRLV